MSQLHPNAQLEERNGDPTRVSLRAAPATESTCAVIVQSGLVAQVGSFLHWEHRTLGERLSPLVLCPECVAGCGAMGSPSVGIFTRHELEEMLDKREGTLESRVEVLLFCFFAPFFQWWLFLVQSVCNERVRG